MLAVDERQVVEMGLRNEQRHVGVHPVSTRVGHHVCAGGRECLLDRPGDVGIERVLVTCDDDNVGSIAVIERCGGTLDEALPLVPVEGSQPKRRYWIST